MFPMKHLFTPLFWLGSTALVLATPSGLNNIPTADTTPQGTYVFQTFTTFGEDRDADLNLGFKTGFEFKPVRFELGLAGHLLPDKGGPVTPHAKIAIPFGDHRPTLAVGMANISVRERDRDRAGDEFAYAVVSQDFGWFRVHGGCGLQDGEALPFFGLDKTFHYTKKRAVVSDGKQAVRTVTTTRGQGEGPGSGDPNSALETRDLFTLRADVIEQRDQSWLYSVGVLVPVCKHFVLEAWGNLPDNGDAPSVTIKGNIVISF